MMWTELLFFSLSVSFSFSPLWWWTGQTSTLPMCKLAIRLFNLETWSFVFSFSSCWWHSAKIYGQEAIGCCPHLEFLYKVALLIERNCCVIWRELCLCLTGCWLPLDLTTLWQKNKNIIQTKKKSFFVQECSAVVVCLMITATNCLSYPLFDLAALALFCSLQKRNWSKFVIRNQMLYCGMTPDGHRCYISRK